MTFTSDTEMAVAKPEIERLVEATAHIKHLLEAERNRGFFEGLRLCITCLRNAAQIVETTTYTDFTSRDDPDKMFKGIARSGQIHFAAQLRAVADEIEAATRSSAS